MDSMMHGPMKYSFKTRLGNWSEEWELEEVKYTFIALFLILLGKRITYQEKIKEDTALINALMGALQQCDYFLEKIDNVEPDLVSDSGDEG